MLCECHAHVFMNGYNFKEAVNAHKYEVNVELVRKVLKSYQDHGIEYVRDGGDNLMVSYKAKELAPEYGIEYRTPIFAIHKNGYYGGIVGRGFDTVNEFHKLVLEAKDLGSDFVKIMVSGILDFDEFGKVSTPLREPELIKEMVKISHGEGLSVMVHTNTPSQILAALEAGCDSIEHGYYMDDECRKVFIETGAVWVPTAVTCGNLRGDARFQADAVEKICKLQLENVKKAIQAGVLVASGSDAGAYLVPHGKGLLDEIACIYEACEAESELLAVLPDYLEEGNKQIRNRFKR